MNITLKSIPLPELIAPSAPPSVPADEYQDRLRTLYENAGCDWVLVYADREHTANLTFLTNFDPRFEEALLVLGRDTRALILGNEGMGYTSQAKPKLDFVLCQSLSLMGQPRGDAPRLDAVLRKVGLGAGQRVGVVGWKYLEPSEDDEPSAPAFVPAYVLRHVQSVVADGELIDVTHLLMHPTHGQKSHNSAAQLAAFEWAAMHASNAVQRVVRGAHPGQTELEAAAALFQHPGLPYICHPMLNSAGPDAPVIGLRSPGPRTLRYGDGMSSALGYWGGLTARAGLLRAEPDEAFVQQVVVPYYNAVATWWQTLRIGVTGDEVNTAVMKALSGASWKPALNPGHLISIDEWSHSPIRPGSDEKLGSGMALQCDIIPAPMPNGWSLNCEDTVALADANLRADLAANFPAAWARIQARRAWMREVLGLNLAEDVLPFANAPACLAPFWLAADWVCCVRT
ncbi:MAG: M24 family metallopeptidase [Anaerolineae bacterium]|nr:M24 family metallopeptidase [Anaerolineae bacterium]